METTDDERLDGPRYAELHCTSNFSFLQGASHPEELVQRAHALGYEAVAITDRGTLAGIVRAHGAAKQAGLRLIIGSHLEPEDAAPLVVWVADRTGYSSLCRLLTRGHAGGAGCVLSYDDIAAHSAGLLAGVPLAAVMGRQPVDGPALEQAVGAVRRWREAFGDRLWSLAELALEGDDEPRLQGFVRVSELTGVPLAVAGDVRYHERARLPLFDVLAAVRHGGTVEEIRGQLLANGERHLQERWRIAARFATGLRRAGGSATAAMERTIEIAGRCGFSLDEPVRRRAARPSRLEGRAAAVSRGHSRQGS
jgi:error-prone DNA polymerase